MPLFFFSHCLQWLQRRRGEEEASCRLGWSSLQHLVLCTSLATLLSRHLEVWKCVYTCGEKEGGQSFFMCKSVFAQYWRSTLFDAFFFRQQSCAWRRIIMRDFHPWIQRWARVVLLDRLASPAGTCCTLICGWASPVLFFFKIKKNEKEYRQWHPVYVA